MKNNVKYIDLINTFDAYAIAEKLSIYEIALFNYLKAKINWNFWKPNYTIATSKICKELNISKPTFSKTREKLKKRNLIAFSEGDFKKYPTYNLITSEKWETKNFNNTNEFYKKFIASQRHPIFNNLEKNNKKTKKFFSQEKEGLRVNQVYHKSSPCVNQVYPCKDSSLSNSNNYLFNYLFKDSKNDFSLCEKSQKNENVFLDLLPGREEKFQKKFFQKKITQTNSFSNSVNNQKEKRKKVASKKEKRFLTKKEHFSNKNNSGGTNIPKTNKNCSNQPKKPLKYILPADEQMKMYISDRGNVISAEQFIAYYHKKGKRISKHWHVLVKQWERNQRKKQAKQLQQKTSAVHTCKKVVGGVQTSFVLTQSNPCKPFKSARRNERWR